MTTYQLIISIVWLAAIAGSFFCGVKCMFLVVKLRDKNIIGSNWKRTGRLKDLQTFEKNTRDLEVLRLIQAAISYKIALYIIGFGTFGLIILSFILNGIFKWQQ